MQTMSCRGGGARAVLCLAGLLSLTACAPSSYLVKVPAPSGMKYEMPVPPAKTDLTLADKRPSSEREFHSGRLAATLNVDSGPIDAPQFLAAQLQQELVSRGLPVQVLRADSGAPLVSLRTFRIQNHRASGFSPFVTLTFLSVDLETPTSRKRIGVFVKRGKIPMWSFEEIVEPTFNQPLSLAVKELASKVANHLYNYRMSDATVDGLVTRINSKGNPDGYLDVYALGFTNNPKAIDTLARLSTDVDEYVRLAAISSLGHIGATGRYEFLKAAYQNRDNIWQDRAMALKAIGDLDTPAGNAFLADEMKFWQAQPSNNESAWTLQILQLYL
jgi:hypothetical protein